MHQCHRGRYTSLLRLLLSVLLAGLSCAAAADSAWRFNDVSRVVAISDVHGAYDAFLRTLQVSNVVDAKAHWQGADTHLVITGDMLDRGADSRKVMDLLMRLEGEAAAAGGVVHVLLGNHEVMNLVGDLRYVAAGEYAAFAAEETQAEREEWFSRFTARAPESLAPEQVREQFDRARPPGFFAHRRAFRADGVYGQWLLNKPLVIVIDGTVFVHGGLSPVAATLGLAGMNRSLGAELRAYAGAMATLTDAALLHPGDSFYAHRRLLEVLPADVERTAEVLAAIATVVSPPEISIHQADGPLWYRGQPGCPTIVELERLTASLASLDAERVVIGHTPTAGRKVVSRLGGRIIEIDTGMLQSYYKGSGHALLMQQDALSVIREDGRVEMIDEDTRLTGAGSRTTVRLAQMLSEGDVVLGETRNDGATAAQVTYEGQSVNAWFYRASGKARNLEVAAYRLDRLLGLDMVPVTVQRTLNGKVGALQFERSNLIDEAGRIAAQAGADAWCPLPVQWSAMYLFDALTRQPARSAQQLQYQQGTWQVVLAGHNDAFSARSGRPAYLKGVALEVTGAWRDMLSQLTPARVDQALGDVLDARRQKALLQRRDELLEGG